jgi:hypothetical protein
MAPLMSWRGAAHVCRLARFQSNAFPPWCLRTAKSSAVLGTRIRCARPPLLIDTDHSAGCGRMDPQVRIMMNHGTYPDCGQQRVAHHATFSDVDGRAVGDRRGSECVMIAFDYFRVSGLIVTTAGLEHVFPQVHICRCRLLYGRGVEARFPQGVPVHHLFLFSRCRAAGSCSGEGFLRRVGACSSTFP